MTQLALPPTTTFDAWRDLGYLLCTSHRSLKWIIGEWLDRGVSDYGGEAREEANRIFRMDEARLSPILDVYRAFPDDKRRHALTFGHHLAVMQPSRAGLIPLPEADRLLAEAETTGVTVAAFKAQVRNVTDRQQPLLDDDPVDASYRAIVKAWNMAAREARELFLESAEEAKLGVIEL